MICAKKSMVGPTVLLVCCALHGHASAQGLLWYNGDFNGLTGLANERNTSIPLAAVYEDFIVPTGQTWNISSVLSNDFENASTLTADWEIRSGVSAGNGGTLLFSGTGPATQTATGRTLVGDNEYTVETAASAVLGPGTYWLSVVPVGSGVGTSFVSSTSGANAVGSPQGNDGNAFFNSSFFGLNYVPTGTLSSNQLDSSFGLRGTVVATTPEFGSVFSLGGLLVAGGAGQWLKRKRQAAAKA